MESLLESLLMKWPEMLFLFVCVFLAVLVSRSIINSRISDQNSNLDGLRTLVEEYRLKSERMSEELTSIKSTVDNLRKELFELREELANLREKYRARGREVGRSKEALDDVVMELKKRADDLELADKALFEEKKRIVDDIDLLWKAMMRYRGESKASMVKQESETGVEVQGPSEEESGS